MKLRTLFVCGLLSVPMFSEAMPSKAELDAVAPVVQELMKPEQDALKAGTKTKTQVADAAVALVAQAEGEAAKLLLAKGAFDFYVRDGAFDKAEETLGLIRAEVPDVTPQYLANFIEKSLRRVSRKNGGELYKILDETKALARYANEMKKLEVQARVHPEDTALMTNLAEHYVVLGDWTKALDAFEKCGNAKAASAAKNEKAGAADAKAIADFWWDYPNKKGDELEKPFKQHAATLYASAVASGKLVGLNKIQVERRIKEAESLGEAVAQAPTTSGGNKLYCVIDLSGGPNAKKYPVSYLDKVPSGGWTDEYKTKKLVLRRIPVGRDPLGRYAISKSFYIGVFEVTQRQWELVKGNRPSAFRNNKFYATRPVENVSFELIRGLVKAGEDPSGSAADVDSFIGIISAKTGENFDLPTGEQWEYACRAGTKTDFNSGKNLMHEHKDAVMAEVGRYEHNGGWRHGEWNAATRENVNWDCSDKDGTASVGSYLPNAYGLYDMHGNVMECCFGKERNQCTFRGGGIMGRAASCVSSSSWDIDFSKSHLQLGFRLTVQPSKPSAKR